MVKIKFTPVEIGTTKEKLLNDNALNIISADAKMRANASITGILNKNCSQSLKLRSDCDFIFHLITAAPDTLAME